jgi:dCMP deaminase
MSSNPASPRQRNRASRPKTFMTIARLFGQRSSCPRADVGAVAVRAGRVIATGYVGAPSGMPHCYDVGCQIENDHCIRTIHAEANLVAWAARVGTELGGSQVYCTHAPCLTCAKLLANAGIATLNYLVDYGEPRGILLLQHMGIIVTRGVT